jgi:PAS domain S-box-containing protein
MAPVGYFTLDEDGRIIEANLTGATLLGIARGALVKQHFGRYVVSEDAGTYYLQRRQLLKLGTPQAFEIRLARENGAPFNAWIEATPAPEGDGAPMWRMIVSDITVRKRAEQAQASLEAQLRESQKMEALGTLAGGIAHDFNNILGTILGNAELARQDAGRNHQALISLEEIQKAGHRARDLVQQILAFSRRQPTARRVISLRTVLEESVRLLRASLN